MSLIFLEEVFNLKSLGVRRREAIFNLLNLTLVLRFILYFFLQVKIIINNSIKKNKVLHLFFCKMIS